MTKTGADNRQQNDTDLVEAAEELYVLEGLSLDQCARRCGISLARVKRWATAGSPNWIERRREYRRARIQVRRGLMLAKARLMESLLADEDPRKATAFVALVRAERDMRDVLSVYGDITGPEDRLIHSPQEAVAALEEAIGRRLRALLSGTTRVDLAAVKDLAAALALTERLKAQYDTDADTGLSDEAASAIRQRILGLNE